MRKGKIQKKIILLIQTWTSLGLSLNLNNHINIYKEFYKEWHNINKQNIEYALESLNKQGFIYRKLNNNGVEEYVLSKKGKIFAKHINIENIHIKVPRKWDGIWRIVVFDIPEQYNAIRTLLRSQLINMGFLRIQQSVYVIPYPCKKEIRKILDFLEIYKYIYFIESKKIDDDSNFKKKFKLFL